VNLVVELVYTVKNNVHQDLERNMTTWHEIGSKNAAEANERMRQERNARASIGPISDVNQTLKEIKALLIEIREAIKHG
jgi:hypothetical protein